MFGVLLFLTFGLGMIELQNNHVQNPWTQNFQVVEKVYPKAKNGQ